MEIFVPSLRRLKIRENALAYAFLAPFLLLFGVFLFYPLLKSVYLSLYSTDPTGRVASFVGFDNFSSFFLLGCCLAGFSLYIMNNKTEEQQKAAWEFIKYVASPEVQAKWSVSTGYFPITKAAYDQQVLKDNMVKYPQFQTAVDQLHASSESTATSGAVMGVFPEARQIVEGAVEEALNGKKQPKQALEDAAKQITEIGQYNSTVK